MLLDSSHLTLQSLLFVPGDRPERFDKALASNAHVVCIDLEDAVGPERKSLARQSTLDCLDRCSSDRLAVRINRVTTQQGLRDILSLCEARVQPRLLLLPKVESVVELEIVTEAFKSAQIGLIPLIESVKGLREVATISAARACVALMFGGHDFAGELGVAMEWEPMLLARLTIVQACAAAGVAAIDAPSLEIQDEKALEEEARRCKALGFTAKAAIHPAQIPLLNRVFQPTDQEIAEAQDAINVFHSTEGSAAQFRGRLLDKPMMRRYELILARAKGARTTRSDPHN
ncbi:MAG: CoA ester lyase [Steroidobacteraceae bacterium]